MFHDITQAKKISVTGDKVSLNLGKNLQEYKEENYTLPQKDGISICIFLFAFIESSFEIKH